VRPEAEHTRPVEAALEEFCRAVRQVGLYSPRHPIADAAVQNAARVMRGLLTEGQVLEVAVSREGLAVDHQPLDLSRPGLRHLHEQLHAHSVQTLRLHPGLQEPEITALISVLGTDVAELEDRGGAVAVFREVQAPHVQLEQQDYRRLLRESEARWLAMFSGAAEARSSVVEQLVGVSLSAVGDAEALLQAAQAREVPADAVGVRPVPQWAAVAEGLAGGREEPEPSEAAASQAEPSALSPDDYLAQSLAVLLQSAWESLAGHDYSERVHWRHEVGQLIGLLTSEMRARLFRAEITPGPGQTDVLTEMVRPMSPDEAVELIMGHPDGVVNEPSAHLEAALRRVMADEQRMWDVEALLRQRLTARGVSEDHYRNVVGLLADRIAKDRALARPEMEGHMKVVTAAATLGGEAPALDDLVTTVTAPAPERARRQLLLDILGMELEPSQVADAVERVGAEMARCGREGKAEAVLGLATALQREADPASPRSATLRAMAEQALQRHGTQEVVACLTEAFEEQPDEMRSQIARLLGQMERHGCSALAQIAGGTHTPRVVAEALKALTRAGRDSSQAARWVATASSERAAEIIAALEAIRGEGVPSVLGLLLEHRDWTVRRRAVIALGKMPGPTSQEILLKVMFDNNAALRAAAAEALGKIGARGAVLALSVAATQGAPMGATLEVRRAAVRALGRIGAGECAAPLIKVLNTRSLLLRRANDALRELAVESLSRIAGDEAHGALVGAVRDPSGVVADAARRAVQERARRHTQIRGEAASG